MKILVAVENRLCRIKDELRVQGPAGYAVWSELLEFFDQVLLVARVRQCSNGCCTERVNGPCVSTHELPDFSGLGEYALRSPVLRMRVREAVGECDAYLLQVPGVVAHLVWRELRRGRKPYAVNVMGDPWDALGPGTLRGRLRPVYRFVLRREMRRMCNRAQAVLHWSRTIQQRYPAPENSYTTVSPRIVLPCGFASPELIRQRVDRAQGFGQNEQRCFKVGFIGSLEQLYKGPDTLLHAVRDCSRAGLEVKAFLVGEGRYREKMKNLAEVLGIQDKVVFLGQLGFGRPIVDFLDSLDLFVMPSRAEGLPRALVEAMARGCPCVGSQIGGIPELLHPDDLVPAGDPQALAARILEVATDPKRLTQMSLRNFEKAKEFDPEILRKKRADFYRHVKLQAGSRSARDGGIALARDRSPLADTVKEPQAAEADTSSPL
jgi:L-malate glycosyltransferase